MLVVKKLMCFNGTVNSSQIVLLHLQQNNYL